MTAKELRDELRALRKDVVKPVSKMRVTDISAEIQRLKVAREETPAVAAVPSKSPLGPKTSEPLSSAKTDVFADTKMARKSVKEPKAPEPKAKKSVKMMESVKEEPKKGRPAKGSEEMKAKMDAIRSKKGKRAE